MTADGKFIEIELIPKVSKNRSNIVHIPVFPNMHVIEIIKNFCTSVLVKRYGARVVQNLQKKWKTKHSISYVI